MITFIVLLDTLVVEERGKYDGKAEERREKERRGLVSMVFIQYVRVTCLMVIILIDMINNL